MFEDLFLVLIARLCEPDAATHFKIRDTNTDNSFTPSLTRSKSIVDVSAA